MKFGGRLAGVLIAASVLGLTVGALPAAAGLITPPPYATCAIHYGVQSPYTPATLSGGAGAYLVGSGGYMAASCQFPTVVAGQTVQRMGFDQLDYDTTNAGITGSTCDTTVAGSFAPTSTATLAAVNSQNIQNLAPGRQSTGFADNHGGTCPGSGSGQIRVTGVHAIRVRFFTSSGTVIGNYDAVVSDVEITAVAAFLPMPTDYYSGGTSGPATHAVPTVGCKRTVGALTGTTFGVEFQSAALPVVGVNESDAYAWNFGDGNTDTTRRPHHEYTRGSQPDGGFLAVITVTRTLSGGDYFATGGGGSTRVVTCSLRVDYSKPGVSDPSTIPVVDPLTGTDCDLGWGFLDPTALPQLLSCVFVPQVDHVSDWNPTVNRVPFGVISNAIDGFEWIKGTASGGIGTSECAYVDFLNHGTDGIRADPHAAGIESKVYGLEAVGQLRLPTPSGSGCPGMEAASVGGGRSSADNAVGDLWGFRTAIRSTLEGILWFLFVWTVLGSFGPKPTKVNPGETKA